MRIQGGVSVLNVGGSSHPDTTDSILVYGDTQFLSRSSLSAFLAQSQWAIDNKISKRIKCALFMGDMVDLPYVVTSPSSEWPNAVAGVQALIDGGITTLAVQGNHDISTHMADVDRTDPSHATFFHDYFPPSMFPHVTWAEEGYTENGYFETTIGGNPFLVVVNECYPRDSMLTWAKSVCDAHPNHTVIYVTHSLLDGTGAFITPAVDIWYQYAWQPSVNDGPAIWTKLLEPCTNIRVALCGHWSPDSWRTDTRTGGTKCHSILTNSQQEDDLAHYGFLSVLDFDFIKNQIRKRTININNGLLYPSGIGDRTTYEKRTFTIYNAFA